MLQFEDQPETSLFSSESFSAILKSSVSTQNPYLVFSYAPNAHIYILDIQTHCSLIRMQIIDHTANGLQCECMFISNVCKWESVLFHRLFSQLLSIWLPNSIVMYIIWSYLSNIGAQEVVWGSDAILNALIDVSSMHFQARDETFDELLPEGSQLIEGFSGWALL